MSYGDINFILFIFFIILLSISINVNTALHLLLTAEILWVTLYFLVIVTGFIYNSLNLLFLTFFFLLLSAVELGIGLVLVLIQTIFFRTIQLNLNTTNSFKFSTRFLRKVKGFTNNY